VGAVGRHGGDAVAHAGGRLGLRAGLGAAPQVGEILAHGGGERLVTWGRLETGFVGEIRGAVGAARRREEEDAERAARRAALAAFLVHGVLAGHPAQRRAGEAHGRVRSGRDAHETRFVHALRRPQLGQAHRLREDDALHAVVPPDLDPYNAYVFVVLAELAVEQALEQGPGDNARGYELGEEGREAGVRGGSDTYVGDAGGRVQLGRRVHARRLHARRPRTNADGFVHRANLLTDHVHPPLLVFAGLAHSDDALNHWT